jgi:PadR family transcriptional regulator AphA
MPRIGRRVAGSVVNLSAPPATHPYDAAVPQPSLTTTSYVVLGIVGQLGASTPYEMKQFVARSLGYFWSFPHSQLYAEPARLAAAGLLIERVEPTGRRRKTYRLSRSGRAALAKWLAEPTTQPTEIRDLGMLKLFFGALAKPAQRRALAEAQLQAHEERQQNYEELHAAVQHLATPQQLATLEMGLRFEREAVAFWRQVLASEAG